MARNYLIGQRPDAIINIVDGTNIERNRYLSTQIMELGIPVVLAVNVMDLVKKSGEQTVLAYCVSLCVYQSGTVFAGGSVGFGTAAAK